MLINFNIHLIILAELAHLAGVLLSQPQLVRWKSIFQARHFRELFVFLYKSARAYMLSVLKVSTQTLRTRTYICKSSVYTNMYW